jgi:hypothetical protein
MLKYRYDFAFLGYIAISSPGGLTGICGNWLCRTYAGPNHPCSQSVLGGGYSLKCLTLRAGTYSIGVQHNNATATGREFSGFAGVTLKSFAT